MTCCIVNIIIVFPYELSAKAFADEMLKAEAISTGKASPEEFGNIAPPSFNDYKEF